MLTTIIATWLASLSAIVPTQCTAGEHYMLVVEASVPAHQDEAGTHPAQCLRVPVVTVCGSPHTLAWVIHDESKPGDCTDMPAGEARSIPISTVYPHAVTGMVQRDEQVLEDIVIPSVPPGIGVCIGPGCSCVPDMPCEHIPVGGPDRYFCTRIKFLGLPTPEICVKNDD